MWQPLELLAYNWMFRLRGPQPWSDRIAVIAVDDRSLQTLGAYPISRAYYVELLDILRAGEPEVIAFDMIFVDTDPLDPILGDRMARLGNVVLAQAIDSNGLLLAISPELEWSAAAFGDIAKYQDGDGVTRRLELSSQIIISSPADNSESPVEEERGALRHPADVDDTADIHDGFSVLTLPSLSWAMLELHEFFEPGSLSHPLPSLGETVWINWPGPIPPPSTDSRKPEDGELYIVSLIDVLEGRVSPQSFDGRLIFVGVTARGLDPLQTPYHRAPETSGVFLHVSALHNLLEGNALHRLPIKAIVPLGLLLGPLFGIAIARATSQRRFWVAFGVVGGWWLLGSGAFVTGLWIPLVWPMVMVGVTAAGVELGARLRTNRLLEAQIEQLWQDYGRGLIRHSPLPMHFPTAGLLGEEDFRDSLTGNRGSGRRGNRRRGSGGIDSGTPAKSGRGSGSISVEGNGSDRVTQLATLAVAFGRSQSAQAAIASSLPVGLVAADLGGRVWFCNELASQWLEVQEGDRLQSALIPYWIDPKGWQTRLRALQVAERAEAWDVERQGLWWNFKVEPILPQNSTQMSGVLLMVQDMTELRQLEGQLLAQNRALERARQEAETATQMKSVFLATMSHEIRTPMNAVVGLAGLLLETPLNGEQADFVNTIRNSGDTLLAIINEILDFSKLEAGSVQLEQIEFNLLDCVESVVDLLAQQAEGKQLELVSWVEPTVPLRVMGDPTRLRQILTNLAGNAIKFTETGGVTVQVMQQASEPERQGGGQLRFMVRDTGIGIAPEAQPSLFESFSQADVSTTRRYGGTGLGLAICRRLVELMGGVIGVDSVLGGGSTFFFDVPLAMGADAEAPSPLHEHPLHEHSLHEYIGGSIYLIDRFEGSRLSVTAWLQHWGMSVVDLTAMEGWSSDVIATDQAPSIVLMNWQSPRDDDALEAIAQVPRENRPWCCVVAPLRQQDGLKSWVTRGVVSLVVAKPLKVSRLRELVVNRRLGAKEEGPIPGPMPAAATPNAGGAETRKAPERVLRILLAEDNRVNQKVACKQLESLGFSATVAANGYEVLSAMEEREFDVVLMDCQMPQLDGFEATKAIRTREGDRRHTVVIAMTASALEEDRERCFAAGMDDFISKPVRKAALKKVLEHWEQRYVDGASQSPG